MNPDPNFRPEIPESPAHASWQLIVHKLKNAWTHIHRMGCRSERRLRLAESLTLGERRFVAVVEFEDSRFLVGGTANSMVLLARLNPDTLPEIAQPGGASSMSAEEWR